MPRTGTRQAPAARQGNSPAGGCGYGQLWHGSESTGVLFGQLGAAPEARRFYGELSARWPGDAYLFARRFCDQLVTAS